MKIQLLAFLIFAALLSSTFIEPITAKSFYCSKSCKLRCSRAGVKDRCLKYCGICCEKCKCVPSDIRSRLRFNRPSNSEYHLAYYYNVIASPDSEVRFNPIHQQNNRGIWNTFISANFKLKKKTVIFPYISRPSSAMENSNILDDLDDLEALRESRVQQMKKMEDKKRRWIGLGHGEYSEILNEKDFFSVVKSIERVLCHFYRENWPCKVLDKHLAILVKQHTETRFAKINAEKSPYLTEKLRIIVFPTLALVKNAKVEDYVVGFDELGGTDSFSAEELEERLAKSKVIFFEEEEPLKSNAKQTRNVRQGSTSYESDSEKIL